MASFRIEISGGRALVDITLYLPDDSSLPFPIGEHSPQQAFSHRIEETGSGLHHVVTFTGLPEHIDLALQAIGESVRIPGAWAAVGGNGCPASSPCGIGSTVTGRVCHVPIG